MHELRFARLQLRRQLAAIEEGGERREREAPGACTRLPQIACGERGKAQAAAQGEARVARRVGHVTLRGGGGELRLAAAHVGAAAQHVGGNAGRGQGRQARHPGCEIGELRRFGPRGGGRRPWRLVARESLVPVTRGFSGEQRERIQGALPALGERGALRPGLREQSLGLAHVELAHQARGGLGLGERQAALEHHELRLEQRQASVRRARVEPGLRRLGRGAHQHVGQIIGGCRLLRLGRAQRCPPPAEDVELPLRVEADLELVFDRSHARFGARAVARGAAAAGDGGAEIGGGGAPLRPRLGQARERRFEVEIVAAHLGHDLLEHGVGEMAPPLGELGLVRLRCGLTKRRRTVQVGS